MNKVVFFAVILSVNIVYSQDYNSNKNDSAVVKRMDSLATGYYLGDLYPSPFGPTSIMKFGIWDSSYVDIIIKGDTGRVICSLFSGVLSRGTYTINELNITENDVPLKNGLYLMYIEIKRPYYRKDIAKLWACFKATARFVIIR